jgi:hypothetical protein
MRERALPRSPTPVRRRDSTVPHTAVFRPRSPAAALGFLHNAAGNRAVQRLLTSTTVMQPDKGKGEKTPERKAPAKKAENKEWSRALVRGPRLLDGLHASFQVWFNHVLPDVPRGKKQLWQVIENNVEVMTKDCKLKTEQGFIIDIVDIDGRSTIEDNWGWIPTDEPCYARRISSATVGFDDRKSRLAEQTNVDATKSLATRTLRKIKGPKGTYAGTYTFVNKALCEKCAKELADLQKKHSAPDAESLTITGLGTFTKDA